MLAAQAIFTLIAITVILYRKNSHNAILWGMLFQWLSINIKIFYASYLGVDFLELDIPTLSVENAIILSNIGIIIMSIAIALITRKITYTTYHKIDWQVAKKSHHLYIAYSIAFTILSPLKDITIIIQLFVYLELIKFSILFIALNYVRIGKPNDENIFYIFLIIEIIISFTGYFADFKDYFYILLLVQLYRLFTDRKVYKAIKLFPIVILLLYLGVIWSSIKTEYRTYLTEEGAELNTQITKTGNSLGKLLELANNLNEKTFDDGLDKLINRISYVEYFGEVIDNVPLNVPHTNGRNLIESITFAFQPRILFPDKAITNDSERTAKYVGRFISGTESNTSISLGYMADGYIDFGFNYFWFTPLLIGIIIGTSYLLLYKQSPNKVWSLAITFPYFTLCNFYGADSFKVIPPLIYYTIVAIIFIKYLLPRISKHI